MKKYLIILSLFILAGFTGFAQDDPEPDEKGAGKLQEKMNEYIQKKLNMNKAEAEKFRPVFLRYLLELRRTHRENKADRPVMQLKIAELRVRFRDEFRQILDEKRANRVFEEQRVFENTIRAELAERIRERRQGGGRNKAMMPL